MIRSVECRYTLQHDRDVTCKKLLFDKKTLILFVQLILIFCVHSFKHQSSFKYIKNKEEMTYSCGQKPREANLNARFTSFVIKCVVFHPKKEIKR